MKQKLRVDVELPQPIMLQQADSLVLFLPDSGGAQITVHGNGTVDYHGNGGGAPQFSLNLVAIASSIRADLH